MTKRADNGHAPESESAGSSITGPSISGDQCERYIKKGRLFDKQMRTPLSRIGSDEAFESDYENPDMLGKYDWEMTDEKVRAMTPHRSVGLAPAYAHLRVLEGGNMPAFQKVGVKQPSTGHGEGEDEQRKRVVYKVCVIWQSRYEKV